MAKKSFINGGLGSVLGEARPEETASPRKAGRPVTQTKIVTKTSQEGTKEFETRATFIVNEELLDELKAIAYWQRSLIKDVLATAIKDTVTKYKKQNGGELQPIPKTSAKK